eukprot:1125239-Amphidinium_carterae.1
MRVERVAERVAECMRIKTANKCLCFFALAKLGNCEFRTSRDCPQRTYGFTDFVGVARKY